MNTKRIVMAFTCALMLAVPTAIARAQSSEIEPSVTQSAAQSGGLLDALEQLKLAQAQALEGTWAITVSPVPPPGVQAPPPFRAYASFARGGGYLGADRRLPFSKQFGTWVHLGGNGFAATFIADLYDQSGNFTGTAKIRTRYLVTGKDEFVGVANAEERDANGNVTAIRCATFRAERITVELLMPQCQSITPPQ